MGPRLRGGDYLENYPLFRAAVARVSIDRCAMASARWGFRRVSNSASDNEDIASSNLVVVQARNAVSIADFLRK